MSKRQKQEDWKIVPCVALGLGIKKSMGHIFALDSWGTRWFSIALDQVIVDNTRKHWTLSVHQTSNHQ